MFLDNALAFDTNTRSCDLVFDGVDLALDDTAATPLLISIGCNRRARPDDVLPSGATNFYTPGSLLARQGWPGDGFDANGDLIGSRVWLTEGAKQTEATRRLAETAAAEGVFWFRTKLGLAVGVTAVWARPGGLALTVAVADTEITLRLALT